MPLFLTYFLGGHTGEVVKKMKHIFFVEDDLSLINGLSFAIRKQGYELTNARTSEEAERLWARGGYDLVILDVTLPDGSGFDLFLKKCTL